MLTAKHQNKTIYIDDYPSDLLKKLSNQKELTCPDCGDKMIYRLYTERQSHFAHTKKECSFPFREPESIEHETGKHALYHWLQTQFPSSDCQLEHHIKATNQRADTFVESLKLAVEFQCSPIQETTWNTRRDLYEMGDVSSLWILGYSMHKHHSGQHAYYHKLNSLEKAIYERYGKIIYFDVLTKQFVILYIDEHAKHHMIGREYFFKPNEVFLEEGVLTTKYDFFIRMQQGRKDFLHKKTKQVKETDAYLKHARSEAKDAKQVLASKKQINYIKYLLRENGKTIPYKLHGLLREEANVIIKDLLKNEKVGN